MDMNVYLTAPLQLDKICRACLTEKGDMRPLFGACLDEMLHSFACIEVSEGDGFPNLMCVQCVLQCSRAYTFKQQCKKSDNILKQYLSPEFQQQLAQSIVNQQQTKEELQEQLQFADHISGVVMEDDISEFVTYNEGDPIEVKEGTLYTIEASEESIEEMKLNMNSDNISIEQEKLKYPCLKCDLSFASKVELKVHMMSYPKDLHFVCNICCKAFSESSILKRHLKTHFEQKTYNCNQQQTKDELQEQLRFPDHITSVVIEDDIPEFVTYNDGKQMKVKDETLYTIEASEEAIEEMKLNMNSDDPNIDQGKLKYPCLKCDSSFALKVDLKVHMMTHPKDLDFVCNICGKAFSEARILKRHLKIHLEQKPHQCDQCDMSFAESSNLSKHKKKHTGELRNIKGKPHLCSVCGRAFKWASSLSKHMKYHTGHKLLSCHYCSKQYVEARSLKIHIRSHTGERPYRCEVCKKSFTQVCNLEKHLRVHTGEKPFLCPICGKGFTQSGYVGIHMRTHTGARPYVCQTCGKAFAGSSTLTIHQRVHTGEKPYSCNTCGKSFSRHETLIIHTRSHTGDKPHICSVCNKGFTSSGHLSGHMRTHTGEKPHTCGVCGKRFSGSSSLKVHLRSHNGEKPFVCKLCNKSFTQSSTLHAHLATHTISLKQEEICKVETVQVAELITADHQTIQVQALAQI